MKKKQQDEKLRRLVSPNGRENFTPSYRNMAFTDNLEGTVDSLQKYKRGPTQTTTAPMMPNLGTNYQVSIVLAILGLPKVGFGSGFEIFRLKKM